MRSPYAVTNDFNPFAKPGRLSFGYGVSLFNLVGSLLFLIASVLYFAQSPPYDETEEWEYLVSEWGVRFVFGIGSALFVVSSTFALPEILSEEA